jgi:Mrp family chromosome partitioning ATPase/capsular polysaccharide biosynthesis protein
MQPVEPLHHLEPTVLAAAWRYRWIVLALTLVAGAAAFAYAYSNQTTEFEARATLVVEDPRAQAVFGESQRVDIRDPERYVADQEAVLDSSAVAERAAEVYNEETGDDIGGNSIRSGLSIRTDSDSNQLTIAFTAADADTAVDRANAVLAAYEDVRSAEARRNSGSAVERLDSSIGELEQELASIDAAILAVRDVDPNRVALDEQFTAAIAQLVSLQDQLARASADQKEAIRDELDDIDNQLATLLRVVSLEEEGPDLVGLFRKQSQAISRLADLETERDRLLVDVELLSSGVVLSSPATGAAEIKSDVNRTTALGLLLGGLAGTGVAYMLAIRRRRFGRRSEPEIVLGVPMLAEVPDFAEDGVDSDVPVMDYPRSASAEAFRFAAASLDIASHEGATPTSIIEVASRDPRRDGPKTFFVTSALLQEGKTVAVANTALAAAREGKRVLAIDADFGNQRLTEILHGKPTDIGLTEVVETGLELTDAIQGIPVGASAHLELLGRGIRRTTAPDFFSLKATAVFFSRIRDQYDLVIVDGPPLLQVAYGSVIAQYVDRVIAVVPHKANVGTVEDLQARFELIGTPVTGYIYNRAPLRPEMTRTEGSLQDILGDQLGKPEVDLRPS